MINYIGLNIRYLLNREKLSQQDIATELDSKQSTISSYLSGRTEPNILMLQKFSTRFKITIDDLINVNLEAKQYTDPPTVLHQVAEPISEHAITNDKIYKAQEKTITTLEKQVALLEKTVDSLEAKLAKKAS